MNAPIFKTGNASFKKALNQVVDFAKRNGVNPRGLAGWSETPDGWRPPVSTASGKAGFELWKLAIKDATAGEVSIECASILKDAANLSQSFAIENKDDVFSVSDGDKIFLKVTDLEDIKIELLKASTWTDYPSRYEVEGTEESATFAAYYYPLYYFDSVSDAGSIFISENLHAHRVCENSNFEIIFSIYQNGDDAALTVPRLIASHAPLPE